ncbi:hypothetical protein CVD28_25635 [Bacillus sp. M6-12]|nr:hypothetical protein CVD28_25635 [Bacillus sp. M6-12]
MKKFIGIPLLCIIAIDVCLYRPSHYYTYDYLVQRMNFIISDLLFLLAVRGIYRKLKYLQFRNILGQILFASFFIYLFFVYRMTIFPFPLLMFFGFAGDAGQFTETTRFIK